MVLIGEMQGLTSDGELQEQQASDPLFRCIACLPLKTIPIGVRARPLSPQANGSLCSTRSSSSSSKVMRRAGSVVPNRKVSTVDYAKLNAPCSAKSWSVTSARTSRMLFGKCEDEMREIASLTKIMTCYLSLLLARDFNIDLHTEVPVSAKAAAMIGTSADLCPGDRVQLIDLLHGLMLPSGNDAAQALAEFFGKEIAERRGYVTMTKKLDRLFVREMNLLTNTICLRRTFFQNPHGMSMKKNHSTARDVGTLATLALHVPLFCEIVNAKKYTCTISNKRRPMRTWTWENTNKLLQYGFDGVKTGITDAAGPCLCASVRKGAQRLVITVLGARSMEERWIEVPRLAKWAFDQFDNK